MRRRARRVPPDGRYRRDHSARSLLLAVGLLLLAAANLVAGLVGEQEEHTVRIWLAQSMRVAGALLVLGGAAVGHLRWSQRQARWVVLIALVVVSGASLAIWLWRQDLPIALTSTPVSAQDPTITGHPALIVSHLLGGGCFLAAAVTFTVDARRDDDELLRWLGPACVLGRFARVNYMLFPSLYSGWLYTGDLLRTGCYLLLLVGAAREISQYWSAQAGSLSRGPPPAGARAARRRRPGARLHRPGPRPPDDAEAARQRILDACDRALDEARAAVDALGPGDGRAAGLRPAPGGAAGGGAVRRARRRRPRRLGPGPTGPTARPRADHPGGGLQRGPPRRARESSRRG